MNDPVSADAWEYRGARALVILHERELRQFVETWKAARARGTSLARMTLEDLLVHVLHWARDYLVWSCEKLELPDPACRPVPGVDDVARVVDDYLEHLLQRWREPFRTLPEEAFCDRQYVTRWGRPYAVEALLEHAVVHPMRHRLQLEELIGGAAPVEA
jgi:uncharacterized damage-inducible protein DinB